VLYQLSYSRIRRRVPRDSMSRPPEVKATLGTSAASLAQRLDQ
jgi:hypothetical protein